MTSEGESFDETTAKKVRPITLQKAITKKGRQFFCQEKGGTNLSDVTPTLGCNYVTTSWI